MEIDLDELRDALTQRRRVPELCAAAAALGLSAAEQTVYGARSYQYAVLTLPVPIPAGALCEAMGWARPYGLSGDVEQRRWHIQLWVADLADPYGQRIHTRRPEVGPWSVTAWLTGRPSGPLLGVVAGASPAYDLATYPALVVALEVHLLADSVR
jgi:hypothetical protein